MFKPIAMICGALAFCLPAFAQDAAPAWTGEGSVSAGYTSGNTETSDFGAGLKLKRDGGTWVQTGEFSADFGETEGVETRNRLFGAGQVDRRLNDKWSVFGRVTGEKDEFSGFETRYFVGAGAAYQAIKSDSTDWLLQLAPGYKVDKTRDRVVNNVRIPGSTEESFGAAAGSRFKHKLNETVGVSNDTDVVYSSTSTQVANSLALTADLMGNLSARISYDVRYETDPLPGFKQTDTAARFSLVYKIG